MTVGDVLDRGLKVLFARLPVFYAINLLVLSPLITIQAVGPLMIGGGNALDPAMLGAMFGLALIALFITVICHPIATAAILHIVMEEYAGRRPTLGAALSFALSRFATLLGASIIVGLIVVVGFFLCCVPGIYFYVTYAFVGQVVVLERLGVGESLQRSQSLVTGHRWRVFGVLLLIGVANWGVQMVLGAALGAVLPAQEMIPIEGGIRTEVNPVNHIIDTLITQLVSILFSTYLAVCTTLLYLDLRIRKEGFDLELAAGGEARRDRDDRDDYVDDERDRDDRSRDRDDGYEDRSRDRYDDRR
jgi:hypothetical protein